MLWVSQSNPSCRSRRAYIVCMSSILLDSRPWIFLILPDLDTCESWLWSPASSGMPWRSQLGGYAWNCPLWVLSLKGKPTPLDVEGDGNYRIGSILDKSYSWCASSSQGCVCSTSEEMAGSKNIPASSGSFYSSCQMGMHSILV